MAKAPRLAAVLLLTLAVSPLAAQEQRAYALKGTVVAPDAVIDPGFISVVGDKIERVGTYSRKSGVPGATVEVETNSFIFPGLIDLHNHITWNLFPRWKPESPPSNRYDWQNLASYRTALSRPHAKLFEEGLGCQTNRYGEVKALVGGATSTVGSLAHSATSSEDNKCIGGLVRNLDFFSELDQKAAVNHERLNYQVFPLELSVEDAQGIRSDLATGRLAAFVVHLAEGKSTDASSLREFRMFKAQGFLRPGTSIIHGVALGDSEFREMAKLGVGLIWSPRSNLELYGGTSNVSLAKERGVQIALSPDWSPTGSDGMIEELNYAARWNASQKPTVFGEDELVRMATTIPAKLGHISDKVGSLSSGLYADLLVLKRTGVDPFHSLVNARTVDVQLVVIGGEPVYGAPNLMEEFHAKPELEYLSVCGVQKALFLGDSKDIGGLVETWAETTSRLSAALGAIHLAPLTDDCQASK